MDTDSDSESSRADQGYAVMPGLESSDSNAMVVWAPPGPVAASASASALAEDPHPVVASGSAYFPAAVTPLVPELAAAPSSAASFAPGPAAASVDVPGPAAAPGHLAMASGPATPPAPVPAAVSADPLAPAAAPSRPVMMFGPVTPPAPVLAASGPAATSSPTSNTGNHIAAASLPILALGKKSTRLRINRMDVDEPTERQAMPPDVALLVLQEQQSLAERQEFIVEQQQAIVQGQREIQRRVQELQTSSPASHKRTHPRGSGSPPDGDADDEDEDESAGEAKPGQPKLPSIFHVSIVYSPFNCLR